jgi:hypothetical protein
VRRREIKFGCESRDKIRPSVNLSLSAFFDNFMTIFDNFLTAFWQLFDNFFTIFDNYLTTFRTFFFFLFFNPAILKKTFWPRSFPDCWSLLSWPNLFLPCWNCLFWPRLPNPVSTGLQTIQFLLKLWGITRAKRIWNCTWNRICILVKTSRCPYCAFGFHCKFRGMRSLKLCNSCQIM